MKRPLKIFHLLSFLISVLILIISPFVFADEALISVVLSRSGNVSYVSISPLHYEARREGMHFIQISPGHFPRPPGELKPMELIIYSTCDRTDPQKGSVLDLRPQFLHAHFLLSPHPNDLPAAYYLTPTGLFRMIKQAMRGRPYFKEEGTIKLPDAQDAVWPVKISREDTTAASEKKDYSIVFSHSADEPVFIQALRSTARVTGRKKIPKVTVLLESPRLYVKATYALIYKGAKNYQKTKSINIMDWWSKQQAWCPRS